MNPYSAIAENKPFSFIHLMLKIRLLLLLIEYNIKFKALVLYKNTQIWHHISTSSSDPSSVSEGPRIA